jgi:hypothetical protein
VRTRTCTALMVLPLALATGACDLLSGPETGRRIVGVLEWSQDVTGAGAAPAGAGGAGPAATAAAGAAQVLFAPDSVAAGVVVPVAVTTVGLSGCWRADGVVVTGQHPVVTITPFDLVPARRAAEAELPCEGTLTSFPRTVHLVFELAGTVTIRVEGRRMTAASMPIGEAMTVEKTIIVR